MDELLDQPFRPRASLAAYRQAYDELEGEVISLDFDEEPAVGSIRPIRARTRRAPSSREARAS